MDVVRGRGGKEYNSSLEVLGFAPASGGDSSQDGWGALRVVSQRLRVIGADITGRDGVDVDAFPRPFVRQALASWPTPPLLAA